MKRYISLKEAKQVGNIYHYTTVDSFFNICKTNTLGLNKEQQKELELAYFEYMAHNDSPPGTFSTIATQPIPPHEADLVFFSRHPNNKVYQDSGVLFILDGDTLSNNYKIIDHGAQYYGKIENELHVPKRITNLKKYVEQIVIDEDQLYLSFWMGPDEDEAYEKQRALLKDILHSWPAKVKQGKDHKGNFIKNLLK
jgi:hypothetical protein